MEAIPKPRELLAARSAVEQLFAMLRDWFEVPTTLHLDLAAIDSAVAELSDPQLVMGMAMRKLQALHLLSTPGVRTSTDVVLTLIGDLERALLQAPRVHLRTEVRETDWDAELAALDALGEPAERGEGFDDLEQFRRQHAVLRAAARAVLAASEGRVRVLV